MLKRSIFMENGKTVNFYYDNRKFSVTYNRLLRLFDIGVYASVLICFFRIHR